ncbi:MAG: hypothetical protein QOE97_1914 [Pseudonocardiales bacterium]|nr:hypothetical protein [Pseudonocardiales bacterium]
MSKSSRTRTIACVTVSLALAGSLAACSGGSKKVAATTPPSTTAAPSPSPAKTSAPPVKAVNPFTGAAPSKNGVVAVKIDDTAPGRPQVNIDKADVVFVEQVEGGLTRLLGIYNTTLPTVEAVRSVRTSDPELVSQFGPIAFVASGGGGDSLPTLDHSSLKASINDRGGPGFSRDGNRPAPYNLTSNLGAVVSALKAPKARSIGWTFGALPAAVPSGLHLNTVVGATPVTFNWDAKLGRYARLIDGVVQHAADGATISTPNVIVQFCTVVPHPGDVDVAGNVAQYTHTVGKGRVVVYRNGHQISGTWSRLSTSSGTRLVDKAGKPIPLAQGGAWVLLVATNAPLS